MRQVLIKDRAFAVAADSDGNRDLGGMSADVQMNGDGSSRNILTRKGWEVDGLALAINDAQGDQEFLQAVIDAGKDVPIAFVHASNVTYSGTGIPKGDFKMSTMNITAPLSFGGPGKLQKHN